MDEEDQCMPSEKTLAMQASVGVSVKILGSEVSATVKGAVSLTSTRAPSYTGIYPVTVNYFLRCKKD